MQGMLTVKKCTIADLEGSFTFSMLLQEYADESSIKGLPPHNTKMDIYKAMESTGVIYTIGAWFEDALIGFIVVLSPVLPHYGVVVSTTESFFVSKEYRKTGAGLELLKRAEEYAMSIGSPGLLVSAPVGGAIENVLPRVGYTQTNAVFFRRLGHESA